MVSLGLKTPANSAYDQFSVSQRARKPRRCCCDKPPEPAYFQNATPGRTRIPPLVVPCSTLLTSRAREGFSNIEARAQPIQLAFP
jgi:hypothetical protein